MEPKPSLKHNINTEPDFHTEYEKELTFAQKKKTLPLSTCRQMFVLATMQMILSLAESTRSGKAGTPADQRENLRDHLDSGGRTLSGGVRAGTRAVTPATGRSGARAAACWGPPPRRARPPPHAWWTATPHRRWWGHSARGRRSTRWRTDSLRQHGGRCDFLSVNLTSIHIFEGLLGLLRSLKFHVSIASGQMRVEPVHWHIDHFDFSISGKDLLDVVPGDVPGQPS